MQLRDYQQQAHDAVIAFITKTLSWCLVEAATGAGKSLLVAALAHTLHKMTGKHILCLAPTAKLIKQNREKFLMTGNPASVYSASAGQKCLRHPVVFGTPKSVVNAINKFGEKFCLIIIDEAHATTPTVVKIIREIQAKNPTVRVVGLTATPYLRGKGYIYATDEHGNPVPEDQTKSPLFARLVYKITKAELERRGFLTPAKIMDIAAEQYDLSSLPRKVVTDEALDKVYLGQGRATALICADFVAQTEEDSAVMVFAATVRHAQEIAQSLPSCRVIGGTINMRRHEREKLEADFLEGRFKYLVSVGTMTTGVDFPHVDAIVLMRRTESLTLLEQIIGRGARLYPGKTFFKLFDYADNLEYHYGEDLDLYNPVVTASHSDGEKFYVPSTCKACGVVNQFSGRPNPDSMGYDEEGYFVDLAGNRIVTDHGPMPGHYGRRCGGLAKIGRDLVQCSQRWTDKKCPECGESNDIAAKYCAHCKCEIVDPNAKLVLEFRKRKRDPKQIQCDAVKEITEVNSLSEKAGDCLRVYVKTDYRSFDFWLFPNSAKKYLRARYEQYVAAKPITTVTYRKGDQGFYEIHGYNEVADECPK